MNIYLTLDTAGGTGYTVVNRVDKVLGLMELMLSKFDICRILTQDFMLGVYPGEIPNISTKDIYALKCLLQYYL